MDRFDNSKPNIILFSDHTSKHYLMKSFGVYKIARELRIAGYEVAVIHHLHVFSFEEVKAILKRLISAKTLFVGFNNTFFRAVDDDGSVHNWSDTVLGTMLPLGREYNTPLKDYIKSLNPNCRTVLGGPTADDKFHNQDFDYVVIGYADKSVVNLANHLCWGEELIYSEQGTHIDNIISDPVAKGFDFANRKMEYKHYDCITPGETLFLEVARGCIFRCSFCSFPLNGKKKLDFIKTKAILIEELTENWQKFGITKYILLDDTFNDSVEKIQLISEVSQAVPFEFEFWAYIRLDLLAAHPETIDVIIDAGLRGCQFGIESINPRTCKSIGKGMNPQRQIETLRYIKNKYGHRVFLHASFIAGLPYESKESMIETYEFFLREGDSLLDSAEVHPMAIEDYRDSRRTFRSKISEDPESYGQILRSDSSNGAYYTDWENEHTDSLEAYRIANSYSARFEEHMNKIIPQDIFFLMSFGYEWRDFADTTAAAFDWNDVQTRKQRKIREYKTMIEKYFDLEFDQS